MRSPATRSVSARSVCAEVGPSAPVHTDTVRPALLDVALANRASEVLALPVHATVVPARTPSQAQFWLLFWLLWISRRCVASVKATVGRTPLSYWWLACQVISPSAPSLPTWYQSVVAPCDWWTSTRSPLSASATA